MKKEDNLPSRIGEQYDKGQEFKQGLGDRGLFDQARMNERFYVGDQWYGAQCGNERPLVRHNLIKRIGDYKMAMLASGPVAVNYSAEGVPNTVGLQRRVQEARKALREGEAYDALGLDPDSETPLVMSALSDYFRTTAERLHFDSIKEEALRCAYIAGTGLLYTWWDPDADTGLYADAQRRQPIKGDIACEVLDVENVVFGDPNRDDVQAQPYILIAQRMGVQALREEARRNKRPSSDIRAISADVDTGFAPGDRGQDEPTDADKATVVTKLWRAEDGMIHALRVCRGVVVRPEWSLRVRLYPLAKFCWERRRSCAYGDSEITYLIPNQIAVNRMISASVWAVMVMGMPIMMVDDDVLQGQRVTNDPGQIVRVAGDTDKLAGAIRYVNPPAFSPQYQQYAESLIANTLSQSGANDVALGDIRPDNTSAIIAAREAATMPLQTLQLRYYQFCEDVARIWAEFWVQLYGNRALKIEDGTQGVWYLPFDADKYKQLLISVHVDVGAASLWSEVQTVQTLSNMLANGQITLPQFLERIPNGYIPDKTGLINDVQAQQAAAGERQQQEAVGGSRRAADDPQAILAQLSPAARETYNALPPEQQQALLAQAMGGGAA